jgi:multidrug resistance efflux pump
VNPNLYRKQATAAYLDTNARGTVAQIAPPSMTLFVGAVTALVAAAAAYAFVGRVQIPLEGHGVVRPSERAVTLRALRSGRVADLSRHPGEDVKKGEPVVSFEAEGERTALAACQGELAGARADVEALDTQTGGGRAGAVDLLLMMQRSRAHDRRATLGTRCDDLERSLATAIVTAPEDGVVVETDVVAGDSVRAGDVVAAVLRPGVARIGEMGVPETRRAELAVGRTVRLAFDAYPVGRFGMARGRIARIEYRKAPRNESPSTPDAPGAHGESVTAQVEIADLPPVVRIEDGMTFTGYVETEPRRLISLLFPTSDASE